MGFDGLASAELVLGNDGSAVATTSQIRWVRASVTAVQKVRISQDSFDHGWRALVLFSVFRSLFSVGFPLGFH